MSGVPESLSSTAGTPTSRTPTSGPPSGPTDGTDERRGALFGFSAYLLWGLFPLYFYALAPAGAWEILAHRIMWTLVLCLLVLTVRRDWTWVRPLLKRRRFVLGIGFAAVVLAVNWTVYVAAVGSGHVTEAALGYFLNPIVTVGLGVLVLGERLRPLQWVAVGVGLAAAVFLTVTGGTFPWIALSLAFSFALYGLSKKHLGATLPALHGLTVESAILTPVAVGLVLWLGISGNQTFTTGAPWHPTLLVLSGVVTAVPLLLFAAAARRVPLVTIGLLQFVTPVMQLLCGVVLLGEHMTSERWVGFGIVWLALVLLTIDSLVSTRSRRVREHATAGLSSGVACDPAP